MGLMGLRRKKKGCTTGLHTCTVLYHAKSHQPFSFLHHDLPIQSATMPHTSVSDPENAVRLSIFEFAGRIKRWRAQSWQGGQYRSVVIIRSSATPDHNSQLQGCWHCCHTHVFLSQQQGPSSTCFRWNLKGGASGAASLFASTV